MRLFREHMRDICSLLGVPQKGWVGRGPDPQNLPPPWIRPLDTDTEMIQDFRKGGGIQLHVKF